MFITHYLKRSFVPIFNQIKRNINKSPKSSSQYVPFTKKDKLTLVGSILGTTGVFGFIAHNEFNKANFSSPCEPITFVF